MDKRVTLHESAISILSLIQEAKASVDSMLQYNTEIAEPHGFTPHSEEDIEFKRKVVARLEGSYKYIVKKITEEI
jgi:hypothetical protein